MRIALIALVALFALPVAAQTTPARPGAPAAPSAPTQTKPPAKDSPLPTLSMVVSPRDRDAAFAYYRD